jgi:hypothetical protein
MATNTAQMPSLWQVQLYQLSSSPLIIDTLQPLDFFGIKPPVFFDTDTYMFRVCRTTYADNELPKRVAGYCIRQVPNFGTRRKWEKNKETAFLVAAWVQRKGCLAPEVWKYHCLRPQEMFICLEVRKTLWELALDLRDAFAVGPKRLFFFGNSGERQEDPDSKIELCVDVDFL